MDMIEKLDQLEKRVAALEENMEVLNECSKKMKEICGDLDKKIENTADFVHRFSI